MLFEILFGFGFLFELYEIFFWLFSDPEKITAYATVVLAIITAIYAYYTNQMRNDAEKQKIEAKKPILSFQIDFPCHGDDKGPIPEPLYLKNYGPLARNLSIDVKIVICNNIEISKKFLHVMGTGERTDIGSNYCRIKECLGKIIVTGTYHDANMTRYEITNLEMDFNLNDEKRVISIPVLPFAKDIMKISNDIGAISTNIDNTCKNIKKINNTLDKKIVSLGFDKDLKN
jgi:hypothetical protein